jgi:Flp pilus assembly protein TadD
MDAYSRGDYTGAIPGLEEAVRADPASPTARFFLAVSYLQLDRRAEAIGHLRGVIQAGESPYLEDALFFLAKAAIRSGDLEAARDELRRVVALDGERREEASRLLQELP